MPPFDPTLPYTERECLYCGRVIPIEFIYPEYCSPECSKRAWNRSRDEQPMPTEITECRVIRLNGITVEQASVILGMSKKRIRNEIDRGKLRAERVGDTLLISKRSVAEHIRHRIGRPTREETQARMGYVSIFDRESGEGE